MVIKIIKKVHYSICTQAVALKLQQVSEISKELSQFRLSVPTERWRVRISLQTVIDGFRHLGSDHTVPGLRPFSKKKKEMAYRDVLREHHIVSLCALAAETFGACSMDFQHLHGAI